MERVFPAMNAQRVVVDEEERAVMWDLDAAAAGECVDTPWASLWVGERTGAGLEVWVEATQPLALALHLGAVSYYEFIEPGRHRLLLPVLDRGDVVIGK